MTKVIKLEPRRVKHEHDRKDAKASAMQQSFREARLEQKKLQETPQQSTRKLLGIFKTKGSRKPSSPTHRK